MYTNQLLIFSYFKFSREIRPAEWLQMLIISSPKLMHRQLIVNSLNSLRPSDAYMRHSHICVTIYHWFRKWLVAWSVPSHYLNQSWNIVNRRLRSKLQWNFNPILFVFIQENGTENVVWKMAAILYRPQCVNSLVPGMYGCNFNSTTAKLVI